jgi:HSP20 family protein
MKLVKSNTNLVPSVFSDFFDMDKFFADVPKWDEDTWLPAVNIKEHDKNYEIDLAIPGMHKEDIKMEIEDHTLCVSAEREEEKEEEKKSFLRREYKYNSFNRTFSLPDNANEEAISSHYENGILKIEVAKKESEAKSNRKVLTIQ